ncbi:hypothetical protein D3C75_1369950 [compost metagenome]
MQASDQLLERLAQGIKIRVVAGALTGTCDQANQLFEAGSVVLYQLTAQQVE